MARVNERDMTPIHTVKNQYRGVNAHLHSYFQQNGNWTEFHSNHISDLVRFMQADLVAMGYVARSESSLQIRLLDEPDIEPSSDVAIFDRDLLRPVLPVSSSVSGEGLLVLPAIAALAPRRVSEKQYRAVGIYELRSRLPDAGEPVAWIEVLSPTNKGNHEDAITYRSKRDKLVNSGIVFVELDYLHETPPSLSGIADYHTHSRRASEAESHPYRIAIIDPRPTIEDGKAYIKEFDVDEKIPTLAIPLNADDVLRVDFDRVYQRTFDEILFGMTYVDYAQFPVRFERYSAADRARIARRMLAIIRAQRNGGALENAPLPVDDIPLESALNSLQAEFDLSPESA